MPLSSNVEVAITPAAPFRRRAAATVNDRGALGLSGASRCFLLLEGARAGCLRKDAMPNATATAPSVSAPVCRSVSICSYAAHSLCPKNTGVGLLGAGRFGRCCGLTMLAAESFSRRQLTDVTSALELLPMFFMTDLHGNCLHGDGHTSYKLVLQQ